MGGPVNVLSVHGDGLGNNAVIARNGQRLHRSGAWGFPEPADRFRNTFFPRRTTKRAFDAINLVVPRGQVVLLGPNGAERPRRSRYSAAS